MISRLAALRDFPVAHKLFSILAFTLILLTFYSSYGVAQGTAKSGRRVVVRVEPEYPEFFRKGHFEGRVVAEASVLPNGDVSNVEIKGGNPMFANFAAKALKKWKYAPGATQTVEEVIFNFNSDSR
jgi:outer membrane biosynthesis protein TonB